MADYRKFFDAKFVGAWDLDGKDVTVEMERVEAETVTGAGGRTNRKPVVYVRGTVKGLLLNKTNAKTIAAMYGNDTSAWIGKRLTLYPTQTTMGSETVDAIRVRPTVPKARAQRVEPRPVDQEMREKQVCAAEAVAAAEQEPNDEGGLDDGP